MKKFRLIEKLENSNPKIIYEIEFDEILNMCHFISDNKIIFAAIVERVNNRGWTISTHSLTGRKVKLFLPIENFRVEEID